MFCYALLPMQLRYQGSVELYCRNRPVLSEAAPPETGEYAYKQQGHSEISIIEELAKLRVLSANHRPFGIEAR
jgi:hypothetical protein